MGPSWTARPLNAPGDAVHPGNARAWAAVSALERPRTHSSMRRVPR
jgi:hypothetical protein